jgi:hypothetical protein
MKVSRNLYTITIVVPALFLVSPRAAEAVTVQNNDTGVFVVPNWIISPYSPAGETIITQDPNDTANFEIQVGVSSFGSVQSDTQASAIYGAGATLTPNTNGYTVFFDTQVYGWDSYDALGTPAPGSTGYWDAFAVNLNQTDYYWNQVAGGSGSVFDPIVTPDPAGSCVGTGSVASSAGPACVSGTSNISGETWAWGALDYANNTFESNEGSYSLSLSGNGSDPYYLSVVLDTATLPESDTNYPSFGAFNPLEDVPPPVVPIPAAVWLFGSALGLLGWIGKRKAG